MIKHDTVFSQSAWTPTAAADDDSGAGLFHLVYTHIGAVLGQRSVRLLADLLSVHLGRAAVVLGIGVVSGAAMLAEEGRLRGRGRHNIIDSFWLLQAKTLLLFSILVLGRCVDLRHWRCLRSAYI